jgi:hypothetical protein
MSVLVTDLYTLAAELLGVTEDALAFTPAGTPDRSYVSPGPPAFDCCDQLTVHVAALGELPTFAGGAALDEGFRGHTRAAVLGPALVITALRCVPVPGENMKLPPVAELEASGRAMLEDAWAIWNQVTEARVQGLFGDICKAVFRDGGIPIEDQGGCGGWQFVYRVEMHGGPL